MLPYSPNPAVAASWAKELQARPTSKARRPNSTGLCPSLTPCHALAVNMDLTPPSLFRQSVYIRLLDVPLNRCRDRRSGAIGPTGPVIHR